MSPEPLVVAVNGCGFNFDIAHNDCAIEFAQRVLSNLNILPFFLETYQEEGDCGNCGLHLVQVINTDKYLYTHCLVMQASEYHHLWTQVAMPGQHLPVSVAHLMEGGMERAANTSLVCPNCPSSVVPGRVRMSSPGENISLFSKALYCTLDYCYVLHCTDPYCIAQYYNVVVLHYNTLYCTEINCTVVYYNCVALCCILLHVTA
jgi:hypothetical protein